MDTLTRSGSLQRTSSQHSYNSVKSVRSQTVRARHRKYNPLVSSSASSINTSTSTSDKSLTSFPSFSPEFPERDDIVKETKLDYITTSTGSKTALKTTSFPVNGSIASSSTTPRNALFDDTPILTTNVPGTIHNLTTEQIESLIARNGAVSLIRQIAKDLAERDTQIAAIRRKADEKERALRKLILECGLSNLDLETRLRAIEGERKTVIESNDKQSCEPRLEDMMNDAMNNALRGDALGKQNVDRNATIRAVDKLRTLDEKPNTASKGWRDFIWGGNSRKTSRASSINRDSSASSEITATWAGPAKACRKTVMQNEVFEPPEKKWSPIHQHKMDDVSHHERKGSMGLTAFALRIVAGTRDPELISPRGRSNSTGTPLRLGRVPSTASIKTTNTTKTVPLESVLIKVPPETIIKSLHRSKSSKNPLLRTKTQTNSLSLKSTILSAKVESDNSGPVEMDTILPLGEQPPSLSQVNNKQCDQEFLTDRYGFIYDHRRRKRYREVDIMQSPEKETQFETLNGTRSALNLPNTDIATDSSVTKDHERPSFPSTVEFTREDDNPAKQWQDHLSIATYPTELLSHTPSRAAPTFEVMEGGEIPRSPSILSEERGFLPSTGNTTAQPTLVVTSDNAIISKSIVVSPPSPAEPSFDTEPVKLLLKKLGDVHDSLQREKTIKWNDFLRKVRAERKRHGEAAAFAASNITSLADSRCQRTVESMPEAMLVNGEIIGVAGLGNKGKVGRAKWNEFKALVLGGIPVAYRAKIWAECSGASTLRIPGYYDSLVTKSNTDDDPEIVTQIKMDINRTLTDNIYFRKGPGVSKLNEVLLAYSRRNPKVGYCQGMNLITACLLLIMPTAEDTFWFLTSIIENILPQGYYDHSLIASRADQQVLRQYVSEIIPKLSFHLINLGIELEALTFQWFLSVFTDCLSAEALYRVWDVVFCTNDGSTFLFQVALALLKLNEPQLLKCETPAEIYTYINHQMTNHAISIDGLIQASEGLRKVVKREAVENRRAKAIGAEQTNTRQREKANSSKKNLSLSDTQITQTANDSYTESYQVASHSCNRTGIDDTHFENCGGQ
ncbi:putative tbc domain-containing protein [Erysiphe neolycopersici]|uniref:Putative tbc domain-containing protein n=1 Tax=Erysiphe neolycopersici TaxID=212602 RepID=A0A420I896_9PEZI|nr:putative tbc domain-containing protein [Erysiphe neolycopersici]